MSWTFRSDVGVSSSDSTNRTVGPGCTSTLVRGETRSRCAGCHRVSGRWKAISNPRSFQLLLRIVIRQGRNHTAVSCRRLRNRNAICNTRSNTVAFIPVGFYALIRFRFIWLSAPPSPTGTRGPLWNRWKNNGTTIRFLFFLIEYFSFLKIHLIERDMKWIFKSYQIYTVKI